MKITATTWTAYTRQLARLNEKAGQLLADYIAAHGTGDTEALIDYAYALVTKYGDSCAFCLTLASRGWQRASQAAIKGGHAEHIHANCDCEYAVRFDGRTSVAGYDPDAYLAQYNAAGGDINRMRRVNYAANKERINAQKRAAYEARKAREEP